MAKKILRTVWMVIYDVIMFPIRLPYNVFKVTFICLSKNREELLDVYYESAINNWKYTKNWVKTGEV